MTSSPARCGRPRRAHRLLPALVVAAVALVACTDGSGPSAVDSDTIPDDGTDPAAPGSTGPGTTEPTTTGPTTTGPTGTGEDDTGDGDDPAAPAATELDWDPCPAALDTTLECATIPVPLDHDDPDGETIELALNRVPATGDREGAVLVNPGGPGGSGIEYVEALGTFAVGGMGVTDFDLIGFDPRGVDASNGLRCLTDDDLDELLYPRVGPDGEVIDAEGDDTVAGELDDDRFAAACRERYGDTLQHYSTVDTARDMDLIREALGDETISYIGISYGTYLGAVYASLFPERVRALVLDSGFEPTGDTLEEQYLTQLVGFEEAFDAWAADCAADEDCAFDHDDVAGAWDALRDRLHDDPIPADDERAVDNTVLETATATALYDPLTWSRLSSALAEAESGDPGGLLELADAYNGRNADGSFSTIQQSNAIISCASGFSAPEPDDPEALAEQIREAAPRWGADVDTDSFDDRCGDLVPPVDLPELGYDGDAPVVVIGGTNDPATPFRWSEELTEAMGPSAVLVTWNGEGHGMLFGSNCLMDVAADVLVELTTPPEGTSCDPDPDVAEPEFWDDIGVPDGVSPEPLGPDALLLLGLPPRQVYGEARTTTLEPDALLDAYAAELEAAGFSSFGREEPVPGLLLDTYATDAFQIVSVLVLTEDAYDNDDLAPARRLVDDGETLFAIVSFDA